MSDVTDQGRRVIADIAGRYGLSEGAVEAMARAVAQGGGGMAQFNIPELGGSGQWMSGGMTMVGDIFNSGLQATVSNLCGELSNAMAATPFFAAPVGLGGAPWWPAELGQPAASGGQNAMRYAYFPGARRLAIDLGDGGPVALLDTLDHQIGGFSQQQSGPGDPFVGLTFQSQYGQFAVGSLPRVGAQAEAAVQTAAVQTAAVQTAQEGAGQPSPIQDASAQETPIQSSETALAGAETAGAGAEARQTAPIAPAQGRVESADDVLSTIERLAKLRDAGALTEAEFSAKKAELLARL